MKQPKVSIKQDKTDPTTFHIETQVYLSHPIVSYVVPMPEGVTREQAEELVKEINDEIELKNRP